MIDQLFTPKVSSPRLALDFTTGVLDPRVSFTRSGATATRVNANGLIQGVAADAARFDYDPVTLACKGLLVEESRVNALTYSSDFSNAAWSKLQCSVSTESATAPDGAITVQKLKEDATNDAHYLDVRPTVTAGASTLSVYVKAAGRTRFQLREGSNGEVVAFDLANPAGNIQSVGNGWYRCWLTATPAATTFIAQIRLLNNSGSVVYTGDNASGLYVWGSQLELGAFPTSHIPTAGASATRNADVAVITGANFSGLWRAGQGGLLVRAQQATVSGTRPWVQFDDGTANVRVGYDQNNLSENNGRSNGL